MRSLIGSRRVALPLAAIALAGSGLAAYGAVGDDGVDYRTVRATTGSVEQELSLSGTISPSGSSELAFGTAGTVAKVRVEQGDEVGEGDVIAVLDPDSLRAAVDRAASDLASAKAQLADDREAQTSAVTASSASSSSASSSSPSAGKSGSGGTPSAGTPSTGTSASTAAVVKQLTAQQDAVLAAQTTASTALSAAGTALADQQAACADPVTTTESTDAPTDAATDGAPADAGTTTTTAVLSEACTSALAAVQSAQATASEAQTALQTALETLGSTLTQALGSVQAGPSTGSSGGGGGSTASGSTPSGAGSTGASAATPTGGTAAGQTVTAATLAQDQASIDRAKADLAAAEADLAGAVVRAPADGTVVSLAVAADDDVAADDTVATVVAPGLTTVSVEATATQAAQLEQGMDVEVTPAGATEALAGAVSRIEHVATSGSSTGSDPTYTVEIVLDARDLQLADGMPASVTAVVGAADDVVVVPASAVSNGSVSVVENGVAERVRVTTGIVGATQIEVTEGLEAGDEVVLADLDADLPSGDSEQGGFGGGGFGGGGFPAGGPPSGGFPAP